MYAAKNVPLKHKDVKMNPRKHLMCIPVFSPLRVAIPFGGPMHSKRVISNISFEAMESQNLPGSTVDRMVKRPNFNRAPRGWATGYLPESNEL